MAVSSSSPMPMATLCARAWTPKRSRPADRAGHRPNWDWKSWTRRAESEFDRVISGQTPAQAGEAEQWKNKHSSCGRERSWQSWTPSTRRANSNAKYCPNERAHTRPRHENLKTRSRAGESEWTRPAVMAASCIGSAVLCEIIRSSLLRTAPSFAGIRGRIRQASRGDSNRAPSASRPETRLPPSAAGAGASD